MLLPSEDPQKWEALKAGWIQEYDPQNAAALALVMQAAEAQWLLSRAQNCFDDAQFAIYQEAPDCTHWTEDHHKLFSRFQRYLSAAERSFQRAFHEVERLRRTYVKQHNTAFNEDLALRRFALTQKRSTLETTLLQSKIDLTQTKTDRLRALPPVRIPPARGS